MRRTRKTNPKIIALLSHVYWIVVESFSLGFILRSSRFVYLSIGIAPT